MKLTKKLVLTGACAGVTLALLTGCSSAPKSDATVAKVGDVELKLGVANLMYRYSQVTTGSYIKMFLGDDGSNLWEQDLVGYGEPYGETLKDSVLDEYKTMVILEQHMQEYGVSLTEEDHAAIEAAAKQFIADNDAETLKQMSATEENVKRMLTLYFIEDRMEKAIEDSADVEVTDEEAAQKRIRYAYFEIPEAETEEETSEELTEADTEVTTEAAELAVDEATEETVEEETAHLTENETATTKAAGETEAVTGTEEVTEAVTETVEDTTDAATESASEVEEETEAETEVTYEETPERTATRNEVQALIDQILAGESFDTVIEEYDPEMGFTDTTYGESDTTIDEALLKAANTLTKDGQIYAAPVENEDGFYIVEMVSLFDEEATEEAKAELLEERKSEYYNEIVEGWEAEAELSVSEKVWATVNYADDFYLYETESEATEEEAVIEEETEAASEAVTESETEAASEAVTESETEAASEAVTESETEA